MEIVPGLETDSNPPREGQFVSHDTDKEKSASMYRMLPPKLSLKLESLSLTDKTALLTDFPQFSSLPIEIRLKIWRSSLLQGRIVKLTSTQFVRFKPNVNGCFRINAYKSTSRPPATLFVNQESREVALSTYELTFGVPSAGIPSTIYFNFELDVAYFPFLDVQSSQSVTMFIPQGGHERIGLNKLKRLGVSHRGHYWLGSIAKHFMMPGFPALEEVIVGAEREIPPVSDTAALEEPQEGDGDLERIKDELARDRSFWDQQWAGFVSSSGRVGPPERKIMEIVPI